MKAAEYGVQTRTVAAFVATNSICQGQQVPIMWPLIFEKGHEVAFAHTSFKWANLASHNAGVTVVIVGISNSVGKARRLYSNDDCGRSIVKIAENINAYLVSGPNIIVNPISKRNDELAKMEWGNKPTDGGHLILSTNERQELLDNTSEASRFVRRYVGSQELINGSLRWCLWITDDELYDAKGIASISDRIERVREYRANSSSSDTRPTASFPHRFRQIQNIAKSCQILISGVSSENRDYLPADVFGEGVIGSNKVFALYDAPLWNLALIE